MRCAVVNKDNLVENLIVAELDHLAPFGCVLIEAPDQCNIGWIWDGYTFINPNPPQEEDVFVDPSPLEESGEGL